MQIEKLSKKHTQAYTDFKNQSHKESKYVNAISKERAAELISDLAKSKDEAGYILLDGKEIIGQLFLEFKTTKGICFIQLISVLKDHYGKGAADLLIAKAISRAKEEKLHTLELTVSGDNLRGIAFYKKKGFKEDRTLGKDKYIYSKKIAIVAAEEVILSQKLYTW